MTFSIKRILMAVIISAGLSSTAYAANQIHYVINNHLGAPEMLVDQSQHVVWQAEYDEFGKANVLVHEVEFNQRLPGQYYDKETGLSYNYYRDYDSSTGRYVQSDPIGLKGGINTYAYALGNPVIYTDPLGLWGAFTGFGGGQYLGKGGEASSGAYWSPDGEKAVGTYTCTGTGGGFGASMGVQIGVFFGDGTKAFEGESKYFEFNIFGWGFGGTSDGKGHVTSVHVSGGEGIPSSGNGGTSHTVLY